MRPSSWWRLAWHLSRASATRSVFWLTSITVLLLSASVGLIAAATLSPEHETDFLLGDADYSVSAPLGLSVGAPLPESTEAVREAGATDVWRELVYEVPFEETGDLLLNEQPSEVVQSDRFRLESGRWPESPLELAVSDGLAAELGSSRTLTTPEFSLEITGVFVDRYRTGGVSTVVGPGLWEALGEMSAVPGQSLTASETLRWKGGDVERQMELLTEAYVATAEPEYEQEIRDNIPLSLTKRTTLLQDFEAGLVGSPILGTVPLLVAPLVTGLVGGWLVSRWQRRITTQFVSIGLVGAGVRSATFLSGVINAVLGIVAGVVVAQLVVFATRPLVGTLMDRPLADWEPAWSLWGDMALGTLAGVMTAQLLLIRGKPETTAQHRNGVEWPAWLTLARRAVAAFAAAATVSFAFVALGPEDLALVAGFLVVALALISPEVSRLFHRLGRADDSAATLSKRMLQREGWKASFTVGVLATLLGIIAAGSMITNHFVAWANDTNSASVPPGMVAIFDDPGVPAENVDDIRAELEQRTGLADPIPLGLSLALESESGVLGTVESPDEAAKLLGVELSQEERDALECGAALSEADDVTLTLEDGPHAVHEVIGAEWSKHFSLGAVMLRPAAVELGVPDVDEGQVLYYVDVTEEQRALVEETAREMGLPATLLDWYRPPDVMGLQLRQQLSIGALGLLSVLVVGVFAGSLAKSLRHHLAVATAIGLPQRWIGRVVGHQLATSVGAALALNVLFIVAMALVLWLAVESPVGLPWVALGLTLAGAVVGALAGYAWAMFGLRPSERDVSGART